jgi:NADH-quinone oxidoreductase subunit H
VVPAGSDRAVFFLAPMLSFVLAVLAWAVIPFNDTWVLSDINVAILFVFAVSSLEVYGVIMGGWASNSKYPFLGALRSAAQMISYEVSLGLIIIGVILSTGPGWGLRAVQLVLAAALSDGFFVLYQRTGRNKSPAL